MFCERQMMKYDRTKPRAVVVKEPSEQLALGFAPTIVSINDVMAPTGYTGLSAFHKYWGKKPIECIGFLVEKLTHANDLVVDPFVGSGLIARECALRKRRFIGIDINPVSIELARMISDLPSLEQYDAALQKMKSAVRHSIDESYLLADGKTASHYLWDRECLKEVWISRKGKGGREVRATTQHDLTQSAGYAGYQARLIRPLRFFQNSRINTAPTLSLSDIFTGRALRNIDLIIESIPPAPESLRRALLLTLTASIGQMSSMVFAITGRGKTTGEGTGKVEVGSWVIGYWRPPLHFEINVWNCFQRRADKLVAALSDLGQPSSFKVADFANAVFSGASDIALLNDNSINALKRLPDSSVSLVLTDPPHSDRIPYLELSELWNAILGKNANFADEIVVSNARERGKTKAQYNQQMHTILCEVDRVLVPGGSLALLFNARDADSWNGLIREQSDISLQYYGCFPMAYSANSVVQDNRAGAMKSDYVLVYRKSGVADRKSSFEAQIHTIPGWSEDFPKAKGEPDAIHVSVG
jgi:16S rRNA G966 N2-methylase RsmD